MPKRRRQVEEEEEQFHVEVIEQARVGKDRKWEYYVKWGGYTSDENSWEPNENLAGCTRLLASFWDHIDDDDRDYEPGDVVMPSPEWIARERSFFQEAFGTGVETSKKKRKESKAGASASASTSTATTASTTSASAKRAVGKAAKQKPKSKKPGWVYVAISDDEEASPGSSAPPKSQLNKDDRDVVSIDSDSDVPLVQQVQPKSKTSQNATKPHEEQGHSTSQKTITSTASSTHPPAAKATKAVTNDPLFSEPPSPNNRLGELDDATAPTTSKSTPKLTIVVPPAESVEDTRQVRNTSTPISATFPRSASTVTTPLTASAAPAANIPKVPTHRARQMNPKVQMIPMQLVDKTGTASIPTKQKLAQKSGVTSKPSPATPSAPPLQPTTTEALFPPQKSLKNLSFKKKSTGTASTPVAPSPSVPSASSKKTPQTGSSYFPDQRVANSPVAASSGWGNADTSWGDSESTWVTNADVPDTPTWGAPPRRESGAQSPMALTADTAPLTRRPAPAIPRLSTVGQQAQKRMSEVDQFMSTIMPTEMSAPMVESMAIDPDPSPAAVSGTTTKKVPQFNLIVAKKWKWTGELYVEAGPDRADKFCNVSLTDLTDPRPLGLRLDILYTTDVTVLRLKKFHDMADLYMLLRACAPIQQCCKVSHAAEGDLGTLSTLSGWMSRHSQFTYADVYLDNDAVGMLIVFPSAISEVCTLFKVPAYLRDQSSLLAALLPWSLSPQEYAANFKPRLRDIAPEGHLSQDLLNLLEQRKKTKTLVRKPLFAQGLRIHKFTADIYEFLTRSPRGYCIWDSPVEGKSTYETSALVAVLDDCGAKNKGYKADVRVIFVHVGALPTLHKLPAVALRRRKQPDMRIYSYGTHPSVPPDRWGLREIYPIGGILTFTALGLHEDLFGLYNLIEQVDQHPLWMCYVHPFALAALFKRDYPGTDPADVVERREFLYSGLFDLIENGTLSVLSAPPLTRTPRLAKHRTDIMEDPRKEWMEWVHKVSFYDRTELAAECVEMFDKAHPNVPDAVMMSLVEKAVMADMGRMQLQPWVMDNYRRFVAVTATRNDTDQESDGVELATAESFDFRDDWFGPRAGQ